MSVSLSCLSTHIFQPHVIQQIQLAEVVCIGGWSHFFRLQLRSCSKIFESGPDLAIFQIWESYSCSDSRWNRRSNRNLSMFLLEKWPHRLLLLSKLKRDSGSRSVFFPNVWPLVGVRKKKQNPAIRSHLWWIGNPIIRDSREKEVGWFVLSLRQPFLYLFDAKTTTVEQINLFKLICSKNDRLIYLIVLPGG